MSRDEVERNIRTLRKTKLKLFPRELISVKSVHDTNMKFVIMGVRIKPNKLIQRNEISKLLTIKTTVKFRK